MLRIKLIRSVVGHNERRRRTITALGLRKLHQTVELPDNQSIRGMVHKVQDMVSVEVVEGAPAKAKAAPAKAAPAAKEEAPVAAKAEAAEKPAKKAAAKTTEKPAAKKAAPAKPAAKKPAAKKKE